MKKLFTLSMSALLGITTSFAQNNNVSLSPESGTVCHQMEISVSSNGNSFNPVSYLWSTGETTPTIKIIESGTYTLTVTGYLGSSSISSTITKSATYDVLPAPTITALTNLWVCKGDTVKLAAVSGYDQITWSNGATGELFQKKMNNPGTPGVPSLDTLSVSYTASIANVCSAKSETVLLRSIRKPHGVGQFYQNKMNIKPTDSIPAGLVLEYIYPVSYEMVFTDNANPLNIIKYNTAPGSRKAPASMLTPGSSYTVVTTPIINNVKFCSGMPSTIGIAGQVTNRLGTSHYTEEGMQTFRIYDMQGKLLMEKSSENFDNSWLLNFNPQMVIVHRSGITSETFKMQVVK
jgi:hypothetical protein